MFSTGRILGPCLQDGDTIGVYSPSGAVRDRAQYTKGVAYLEKHGFAVKEAAHTFDWESHYSAQGAIKAQDFHALLRDPKIKVIIPSVGGHTSIQMLPFIDWELVASHPKLHVGFSDNSLMVNLIAERTGLITFHSGVDIMYGFGDFEGKNPSFSAGGQFTVTELFESLRGRRYPGKVNRLGAWRTLHEGKAEGVLKGGNLDTLQALIGTPYAMGWQGAIFFWESTDDPHRVDLFFMTLHMSGVLNQIAGMVIGRPSNCEEKFYPERHDSIERIVERYTSDKRIPVIIDADIGHSMENACIPVGARAAIDGNSLTVLEEVVK